MKKIAIIGTRKRDGWIDFDVIERLFFDIYEPGDWIVSGGCPTGGDRFAKKLHQKHFIPYLEFPANWKKYGKGAGFIRNSDIAKNADILISCLTRQSEGGADDTVKKFKVFNMKPKLILNYEDETVWLNLEKNQ